MNPKTTENLAHVVETVLVSGLIIVFKKIEEVIIKKKK